MRDHADRGRHAGMSSIITCPWIKLDKKSRTRGQARGAIEWMDGAYDNGHGLA